MPSNPSLARSSASTNASTARTGLLSLIQSSRHSGNKVDCPRSAPTKKRFIDSLPPNREENHNIQDVFTQPGSFTTGVEPAADPAMSAVPPKAEVKSEYWHLPRWSFAD